MNRARRPSERRAATRGTAAVLARRWVRRVPIGRGPLPSWDETQERRSLRAGYRTAANARKPPLRDLFWPAGCSRHRHADAPSRGECGMREVDCGDDSTVRSTWETRPPVDSWLGTTGCSSAGRRWSWRATSAKPMGSRSPRSLHDSVARRRQSKRTSRTRLMLTKGPAGNGRPSAGGRELRSHPPAAASRGDVVPRRTLFCARLAVQHRR